MRQFTIPPLTGIEPFVNIKPTDNGMTAEIGYTVEAIEEMLRRANEVLDEELMARLAKQHGYVKVVRCEDCKYARQEVLSNRRSRKKYQGGYWCDYWSEGIGAWCEPDGFCKWGEPKGGGE